MTNPEEFFDSILRTASAYPVTIFNTAFAPAKLFKQPPSFLTCSAGTAVTYSFLIVFLIVRRVRDSGQTLITSLLPSEDIMLIFAISSVALVALQRPILLAICGRNRRAIPESKDIIISEDLAALLYPLSLGILLGGLGVALLNLESSLQIELLWILWIIVVPGFYMFALFNSIRTRFSVKAVRALLGTAALSILPFSVIFVYVYIILRAVANAVSHMGVH